MTANQGRQDCGNGKRLTLESPLVKETGSGEDTDVAAVRTVAAGKVRNVKAAE
jgi:hypothetical protein